jgi:hypothetical protein
MAIADPVSDKLARFNRAASRSSGTAWEKERKSLPGFLPCASSQSIFTTPSTGTILCLAHGAISGFDLDARPLYNEKPEETHIPNGGDPPPPYVDPDH